MKLQSIKLLALVLVAMWLSACSSPQSKKGDVPPPQVEERDMGSLTGEALGDDASISGARDRGAWTGNPLDNPQDLLYTKVVYFDFDRSDIRLEFRETILAHGAYLAANPSVSTVLEGHCDERGTREYNIALGERRANAVKRLLVFQGASESQITTVSYGEERPAVTGSHEDAWAQNRRAVFVY